MSGLSLRASSKFGRLHAMLGIEPPLARGLLEFLWDSVYEDGTELIGDAFDVEYRCGWQGEAGKLCQALLRCGGSKAGFIEELPDQPGVYRLHDLVLNVPKTLVRKWANRREREEQGKTLSEIRSAAARKRWDKERGSPCAAPDANACKTMQTDANCIDLHSCSPAATPAATTVVAESNGAAPATNGTAPAIPISPPAMRAAQAASQPSSPRKHAADDSVPAPALPTVGEAIDYFHLIGHLADSDEAHDFRSYFIQGLIDPRRTDRELDWRLAADRWVQRAQSNNSEDSERDEIAEIASSLLESVE